MTWYFSPNSVQTQLSITVNLSAPGSVSAFGNIDSPPFTQPEACSCILVSFRSVTLCSIYSMRRSSQPPPGTHLANHLSALVLLICVIIKTHPTEWDQDDPLSHPFMSFAMEVWFKILCLLTLKGKHKHDL